jgi:hypothetical protein
MATTPALPPTPWAAPGCSGASNPSQAATAFGGLKNYTVAPICPADVGPGLTGAEITAQFSDLAAGEVTDTSITIGTDPPGLVVLRVLVGTLKSGSGEAFVDAFLSRLGPDARNGTIKMVGKEVPYFVVPGGYEGYAYGAGSTVVIGFIRDPGEVGPNSAHVVDLPAGDAFSRILAAATGAPLPADSRLGEGVQNYPLGRGRFTVAGDPGWVFFTTDAGQHCGIGPGGTIAGCDNTTMEAPEGTNQTVVREGTKAGYVHSETPAFTREVDILPAGRRLDNGIATCTVGYQGAVGCTIGEHKFVIATTYGVLE